MKKKTLKQGQVSAQKAVRLAIGWVGNVKKFVQKEVGHAKSTKRNVDSTAILMLLERTLGDLKKLKLYGADTELH
jgi:hypothetical protein